jgi:predicted RNase H-like nuclease
MRVAGVDGCRSSDKAGGWIAVVRELEDETARTVLTIRVVHLAELLARPDAPSVVAVDMPIGLPDLTGPKGRAPERLVRPRLGGRQSSVFSIPSRAAVYAGVDAAIPLEERYRHACAIARETSDGGKAVAKQGFHIFPKIVEIDRLLRERPEFRAVVRECHPEVAFWAMNGEAPLAEPKKVKGAPYPAGLALRRRLLEAQGFEPDAMAAERARTLRVGADDLIDACAASWTAARIARGHAVSFPDPPEHDAHGLPVAIWA